MYLLQSKYGKYKSIWSLKAIDEINTTTTTTTTYTGWSDNINRSLPNHKPPPDSLFASLPRNISKPLNTLGFYQGGSA